MRVTAQQVVGRARSLLGTRFRPQGRDPGTGLDCVGLVLWCFGISPDRARRDYRLRGAHRPEVEAVLSKLFARTNSSEAGHVLLFAVAADQSHLAVSCGDTFIHADAALRRVVETPAADFQWPLISAFCSRTLAFPD